MYHGNPSLTKYHVIVIKTLMKSCDVFQKDTFRVILISYFDYSDANTKLTQFYHRNNN